MDQSRKIKPGEKVSNIERPEKERKCNINVNRTEKENRRAHDVANDDEAFLEWLSFLKSKHDEEERELVEYIVRPYRQ